MKISIAFPYSLPLIDSRIDLVQIRAKLRAISTGPCPPCVMEQSGKWLQSFAPRNTRKLKTHPPRTTPETHKPPAEPHKPPTKNSKI